MQNIKITGLFKFIIGKSHKLIKDQARIECDYVDLVKTWTKTKALISLDKIDLRLN